MAEAVGLAASVIAIGQVAGAVGKSVLRLKNLWDEVNDVPGEISDLLEELQILDPLLKGIDKEMTQNSLPAEVWDTSGAQLSKQYCQQAMESLCNMTNDLDREIKESRGKVRKKIASAKAILKKDSIARHEKKLRKALNLLDLAMRSYQMAMARVSLDLVRKYPTQLSAEIEVVVQIPPTKADVEEPVEDDGDENPEVSSWPLVKPDRQETTWSFLFGSITYESSKGGTRYVLRIQPPSWITQSIWEFESRRAHSCWHQINMRVYSIQPENAEVFRVIQYGMLDRLLEMFDKGEASPFDRDPAGASLLHRASQQGHLPTCRALLQLGLYTCIDEDVQVPFGARTPRNNTLQWEFSYAGVGFGYFPSSEIKSLQDRIGIMDLFWKFGIDDCVIPDDPEIWQSDFFLRLQREGIEATSYHSLPLRQRLLTARNNVHKAQWMAYRPVALAYLINKDCHFLKRDIPESVREGVSLIHTFALAFGGTTDTTNDTKGWNMLAREIASAATIEELSAVEECGITDDAWRYTWEGTPLVFLIHGFGCGKTGRGGRTALNMRIRHWLGPLKECGVDLVQYGLQEKRYLSRSLRKRGTKIDATLHGHGVGTLHHELPKDLLDIDIGPEPEDWALVWKIDVYEMARDFFEEAETLSATPEPVVKRVYTFPARNVKVKRVQQHSHPPKPQKMPGGWVD